MISKKIEKYILRNKIEKIIASSAIHSCRRHQGHVHSLDNKIKRYLVSKEYYTKKINESSIFVSYPRVPSDGMHSIGNESSRNILKNNKEEEVDYENEKYFITERLIKGLSEKEFKTMCEDIDFYIQDKFIRDLLNLLHNDLKLYQIIEDEDKYEGNLTHNEKLLNVLKRKKREVAKYKSNAASMNIHTERRKDLVIANERELLANRIKAKKQKLLLQEHISSNISSILNKIHSDSSKEILNRLQPVKSVKKKIFLTLNSPRAEKQRSRNSVLDIEKRVPLLQRKTFKREISRKKFDENQNNYYINKYTQEIKNIFTSKKKNSNI